MIKDLDRKINGLIEILRTLTGKQGHAALSAFDPNNQYKTDFAINVIHERDGRIVKEENLSEEVFRNILRQILPAPELPQRKKPNRNLVHANISTREDRIKNLCGVIGAQDLLVEMEGPLDELQSDLSLVTCPDCCLQLRECIEARKVE